MAPPFKFHPDQVEQASDTPPDIPSLNKVSLVKTLSAHVQRAYEIDGLKNRISFSEPWRNLPEIPSSDEINPPDHLDLESLQEIGSDDFSDETPRDSLFLPHNRIDRAWDDKAEYIGTHYQLVREDGVAPLRSAVSVFKQNPDMQDSQDVCIYTNVHIIGYTLSTLGPAARLEFSFERAGKRIRWEQSSRLKQGTIVAITPRKDSFRTICKIAVIAARPLQGLEQNPPQIDLFWASPEDDAEFDPLEAYTMVEARSGYFEFNRHMLVAMQKLMTESFPMEEHLVNVDINIEPPAYLKAHPLTNLNALADTGSFPEAGNSKCASFDLENVDILSSDWPDISTSSLDRSQMQALKRMLTKKIAIVQGPPGTGKTFVSVSALRVMLDNLAPGDPPLIIAAQTNHALDQLLTHILPFEKNFIRLGGRTSKENQDIVDRTLYEVRLKNRMKIKDNYRSTKRALDDVGGKLTQALTLATAGGLAHPQIWFERNLISKQHLDSLHDDEWASAPDPELPQGPVALWLGREQIVTAPVGCPPINMGFLEEETDVEFEKLAELETEVNKIKDDDIDALLGVWVPLTEEITGKPSPGFRDEKIRRLLDKKQNLWEIPIGVRGEVYRYLQRQLKSDALTDVRVHAKEYMKKAENVKIAKWEKDANLITGLRVKIIGCTTTGLSKYRGLLAALSPRTLLIEEAAETLEGTVLAAMFESLEHLVLVGDHKQLRAQCSLKLLEEAPYSLAISMFERLVTCGVEYTMLNEQRRMIPEIRELLSQEGFYEKLEDHSSVLDRINNRKPVPGMGGRDSLIFHHTWPESRDDAASRYNLDEAEMIVGFFRYLVLNGVDHSCITVLTYYNGQRNVILRLLKRSPDLQSLSYFKVFTVDSYQGEENDIILLSLVRSNDYNQIGFLDSRNRAVVALSRARRGMYIFGNIFNLIDSSKESRLLWGAIFAKMLPNRVVQALPVTCTAHGKTIDIKEPGEWDGLGLTGGCDIKCRMFLPCGHKCPYRCHPFSHDDIRCKEPCPKVLSCGHKCEGRCGDRCHCECDALAAQQQEAKLAKMRSQLGNKTHETMRSVLHRSRVTVDQPELSQGWKNWNPTEADAAAELNRLSLISATANTTVPALTYLDTHRPVDLNSGVRVVHPAAQRVIGERKNEIMSVLVDANDPTTIVHRTIEHLGHKLLEGNTPPASSCGPSPDPLVNKGIGQFVPTNPTPANSSNGQSPPLRSNRFAARIGNALSPIEGSFLDDDEHIFAGIDPDEDVTEPIQQPSSYTSMSHSRDPAYTPIDGDEEDLLISFD